MRGRDRENPAPRGRQLGPGSKHSTKRRCCEAASGQVRAAGEAALGADPDAVGARAPGEGEQEARVAGRWDRDEAAGRRPHCPGDVWMELRPSKRWRPTLQPQVTSAPRAPWGPGLGRGGAGAGPQAGDPGDPACPTAWGQRGQPRPLRRTDDGVRSRRFLPSGSHLVPVEGGSPCGEL